MARNAKEATNLQVFRGSRPALDVFAKAALEAQCCGTTDVSTYDKLAQRVRFDNGLSHLSPLGGREEFTLPDGTPGWQSTKVEVVDWINANGVGASISVIAIPTYAFVKRIGIHVDKAEAGLTFTLASRNGLDLGNFTGFQVTAAGTGCEITRTLTALTSGESPTPLDEVVFGALSTELFRDYFFCPASACGEFSLEADELMLVVASVPAADPVVGDFSISVTVAYEVAQRAEA